MDFVEKNATVFPKLIQCLDDKSLSFILRDAKDNEWKALGILREYYLSKRKPKVISLYTELTSLRRLESESITNYIIKAENISNALKEADDIISNKLLIAMVLKEYYELYWISPGSNTPQNSSCVATYHPSRKPFKLDEPDMQDTPGEVRMNS